MRRIRALAVLLVTIVESIESFRLTVPVGTRAEQYRGQGCMPQNRA